MNTHVSRCLSHQAHVLIFLICSFLRLSKQLPVSPSGNTNHNWRRVFINQVRLKLNGRSEFGMFFWKGEEYREDGYDRSVTLTVTLVLLFVLRSSLEFLRKRKAASSLDIRYALRISNRIEKVHASRRICFKIRKNPSSLISSHTLTYVVHKIQPNSPFDWIVSFAH